MRAISPVIGTVVLVGVTVALATVVGASVLALPGSTDVPQAVAITAEVTSPGEFGLILEAGGPIDVREVTITIDVDGEPLEHQPTVPSNSMTGFGAPSGPFHAWSDPSWTAGERAGFALAVDSNSPAITTGARVRIGIAIGDYVVADIETTAR